MLTFASGGWVILLVALLSAALLAWAFAPVVLRRGARPPGDGRTIESFGFDLTNLSADRDYLVAATLHRDMVPAMNQPSHSGPNAAADTAARWDSMQKRNDPKYGKYLVSSDLVIGVTIDGESRAYPLHVLYVHEIINDVLGGAPITVTYHWPCASATVFDRRLAGAADRVAVFAHSGLLLNSNLVMYDRNENRAGSAAPAHGGGGESLYSQLQARAISGRAAAEGVTLQRLPLELVTWRDWSERHPETTIVDRDLSMFERYKDAAPTQYFNSDKILYPVPEQSLQSNLEPKTNVLAVMTAGGSRVYPIPYVLDHAAPVTGQPDRVEWRDAIGLQSLRFIGEREAGTLRVEIEGAAEPVIAIPCYWFAWRAMHPETELMQAIDRPHRE